MWRWLFFRTIWEAVPGECLFWCLEGDLRLVRNYTSNSLYWYCFVDVVVATNWYSRYFWLFIGSKTMHHFYWCVLAILYQPMRIFDGELFWFYIWRINLERSAPLKSLKPGSGWLFQLSILILEMSYKGELSCWIYATLLKSPR